jgi:hypothetical protein
MAGKINILPAILYPETDKKNIYSNNIDIIVPSSRFFANQSHRKS